MTDRKIQTHPETYDEFLKRKAADEERVLHEAQECVFRYAAYSQAVTDWNAYVAQILPYAEVFKQMAEALCMYAGFARCPVERQDEYFPQLKNARNKLESVLKKSGGREEQGVFVLPGLTASREFEKKESFHLSELRMPELSLSELEVLNRIGKKSPAAAGIYREELKRILRRFRAAQKENLLMLREKSQRFAEKTDYLERKRADREKHVLMREAVRQTYPIVKELLLSDEENRIAALSCGARLQWLWMNIPGRRLCLVSRWDADLPEEIQMEFQKAEGAQLCYPGLYWREQEGEQPSYERIISGWYR